MWALIQIDLCQQIDISPTVIIAAGDLRANITHAEVCDGAPVLNKTKAQLITGDL